MYKKDPVLLKILGASFDDILYAAPEDWTPAKGAKGAYTMIYHDEATRVTLDIKRGPDTGVTSTLWMLCMLNAHFETGAVQLEREDLARLAGVNVTQVSRSMKLLHDYGAVETERHRGRARYICAADVGWIGNESELQRLSLWMKYETTRLFERGLKQPNLGV